MKTYSAEDLLNDKFGIKGSDSRTAFSDQAFSVYFAEIIRVRRKQLNLTQEDLAQRVGKKRAYISRVERGEDIQVSNFALIANALGLEIQIRPELPISEVN